MSAPTPPNRNWQHDAVNDIAEREYDLTSRHVLVARLLEALAPPGPILDIGGSLGLTQALLPGRQTVTVDLRDPEVDALASGAALPFRFGAFGAAIALDVLEHVPVGPREELVDEAAMVADVVILAGPYDEPGVAEVERQQREAFQALFGEDHPWLAEHADCGLPSLDVVTEQLRATGRMVAKIPTNPLRLWGDLLYNTHVALRVGFDERTRDLRRWLLNEFLDRADATPPSYRWIVVASTNPNTESIVRSLTPGQNPDLVADAIHRTRLSTSSVINQAQSIGDELKASMSAGWEESVARVRHLEAQRDIDPAQASERALIRFEAEAIATPEWYLRLRGPVVTGQPATPADVPSYEEWLGSRATGSAAAAGDLIGGPSFSILCSVFDPPPKLLEACIRSVRAQSYGDWELVLLDVSDADHVAPILDRFRLLDDRIKVIRGPNKGIALNTMTAAAVANGDWLAFLDHDDTLAPNALAAVAERIALLPDTEFVYSDEGKLDEHGRHLDPFFKPDWSPDLLRTVNYIGHFVAVSRDLFLRVGGLREGFDAAQDYDFNLRATNLALRVEHVPDVLYFWRLHGASTASDVRVKPTAHSASRRALQDFATRIAPGTWVEPGPGPTSHRLRYPIKPQAVSIIIPFRDRSDLTQQCLDSIAQYRPELPFEILLISNRSEEARTFEAMDHWQRMPNIRVLEYDHPYHFQAMNNWAVAQSEGALLLLLNNDTEAIHFGWLEALAEHAQRPEVGLVGGRLFYPDGLVQHAGVAVGIGGFADHPWARLHPDAWTPAGPSYWVRNFLSVTAACAMVGRETFDAVGGLDERFEVCGGDVDLGLRLHERGYWNVMTPYCRLIHHESASRDRNPPAGDISESRRAYARFLIDGDPFYNINLTRSDTSCALARPARALVDR